MNKEEPHRDQAEKLRKKIEKISDDSSSQGTQTGLPPRSKVHHQQKKKVKVKLKYPIIRLLALFFILLPIVSFSIYTLNENKKVNQIDVVEDHQGNFELVDVEDQEENVTDETKPDRERVEETKPTESNPVTGEPTIAAGDQAARHSKDKTAVREVEPHHEGASAAGKEKIAYHRVQPNETLFRIAMRYYQSQTGIEKIKQANGMDDNEIQVGQTLKIPLN